MSYHRWSEMPASIHAVASTSLTPMPSAAISFTEDADQYADLT